MYSITLSRMFLIACDTTYAALTVQRSLADSNPTVIPTPRDITESCGMALRFAAADQPKARELAENIKEARGFCSLYQEVEEHRRYDLICHL